MRRISHAKAIILAAQNICQEIRPFAAKDLRFPFFRFLANLFAREYNKPFVLEKENYADVQRIVAEVCISIDEEVVEMRIKFIN